MNDFPIVFDGDTARPMKILTDREALMSAIKDLTKAERRIRELEEEVSELRKNHICCVCLQND